jgi:hypothetical protein
VHRGKKNHSKKVAMRGKERPLEQPDLLDIELLASKTVRK